jgi:hypothetical protein
LKLSDLCQVELNSSPGVIAERPVLLPAGKSASVVIIVLAVMKTGGLSLHFRAIVELLLSGHCGASGISMCAVAASGNFDSMMTMFFSVVGAIPSFDTVCIAREAWLRLM